MVSDKGASGKVGMGAGPLEMDVDAVTMSAAEEKSYHLSKLDVVQELVHRGSIIVVSLLQKDTVWIRHIVIIIPSINIQVFPEGEESLWEKIQETTSGIGLIEILDFL